MYSIRQNHPVINKRHMLNRLGWSKLSRLVGLVDASEDCRITVDRQTYLNLSRKSVLLDGQFTRNTCSLGLNFDSPLDILEIASLLKHNASLTEYW